MAVITISREMGSDGERIVDLLCEQLGYCKVDKAMLTQIAQQAGVNVEAVLEKEKEVAQKPRLISDQMTSLYGRAPSAFGRGGGLDDQTYVRIVAETMEQFARQGKAIIVGRGGAMVLRDWPTALHVHIYASMQSRLERLMKGFSISELEAKRRIAASDEQKRLFFRNMHGNANWKDLKHYHLAINTTYLPAEAAAEIIATAARHRTSAP